MAASFDWHSQHPISTDQAVLELIRMSVATNHHGRFLRGSTIRGSTIRLTQLHAAIFGSIGQLDDRSQVEL
jgi:hypothetical protein